MKMRRLSLALIGASILIPMNADAQRVRARNLPAERVAYAPSARLADCRAPRNGRAYTCRAATRDRVVYSYSRGPRGAVRHVWIAPAWGAGHIRLPRNRRLGVDLNQHNLRNLLGAHLVNRVRDHGRDAGLRGPLRGHWARYGRFGDMLVLTVGGQEVARLFDHDRDGFVDELLLRNFRAGRVTW